ncbi:glycosyltransferase 87 family protein [Lichenicoccus sp.]|uniref:glycosyltransferase 87 family protein n=1 Tax=Lichenicoccus sp. TaxID=2781899 RepID=UPI003D0B492C
MFVTSSCRRDDLALSLLGILIVALILCGLALHRPGAPSVGSIPLVNGFVALLAAAGLVFLLACSLVLRRPPGRGTGRRTLLIVLVVAALMRAGPLLAPPFLSSDLYRYVWDGRVQRAGINPYRFIPADAALSALRDEAIYPHVNRRDYAPTIYPPVAQLLFRAVASVSQTALAMKSAAVLMECLAIACLVSTLRHAGLPAARVLLYAWNPLAAWTFAGNGHVDAAAVGFLALALLLRVRGQDGWSGVALGAAVLVKFIPAAVVPAFWRWRWRFPAALVATMVLLYLPFLDVGWRRAFGFLGAYGGEEGLRDGSGIWLLAGLTRLGPLPPAATSIYLLLSALGLAALALATGLSRHPGNSSGAAVSVAARAGCLAAAVFLVLSPHYPWYFPWLGLFAALAPAFSLLWLSVAPLVLYLDPWHEFFIWPSLVYVPAILLAAIDIRRGILPFGTTGTPTGSLPA